MVQTIKACRVRLNDVWAWRGCGNGGQPNTCKSKHYDKSTCVDFVANPDAKLDGYPATFFCETKAVSMA